MLEFIKQRGEEYRHSPALVKCECGEEFYLEDQYLGSCECPNCGSWYNLFGQSVLAPDQYDAEGW